MMTTGRGTGLALALISAAAFGTSGALAGSLIAVGWSPAAAVLVRVSLAALVLTVPALVALRGRWHVLRGALRMVLAYGLVAVAGAQLAYFYAVSHLSVGVALLLEYQGIVLVVAWGWLRHGRRPRPLMLAGAGLALAGLALVLDVLGGVRLDGIGVLWGLAAAVGLAVYFVVASESGDDTAGASRPAVPREPVPPLVLSCAGLWTGAAGLALAAATGALDLHATTAPVRLAGRSMSWLVPVLGLSLVAAALAYVVGTLGARLLGATLASFVGLTEVVFAVLFAWVLLGQLPTPVQLVGGLVVVAGIAVVRADELRRAPAAAAADVRAGRQELVSADAPPA
jgi:drug/metabolite transporter (DMT)-like permease